MADVGQANEPRTQLGGALAILGGGTALRAVQAPFGVARLVAGGAEVRASRAPHDRADAPNQPSSTSNSSALRSHAIWPKRDHAGQGHERVAEHEHGHRDGDVAARQDQLRPDADGEQR